MTERPSLRAIRRRTVVAIILVNLVAAETVQMYLGFVAPRPASSTSFRDADPWSLALTLAPVIVLLAVAMLAERRRDARIKAWDRRLRQGADPGEVPLKLRRAILNTPLRVAGITSLMWLIAGLGSALQPNGWRVFLAVFVVGGLSSAILLFFIVDVIWRPLIPVFFPDGNLSQAGAFRLPMFGRLLIAFLVVGLLPPAILVNVTREWMQEFVAGTDPAALLDRLLATQLYILAAAAVAGLVLAVALTRGITSRLKRLQETMRRVEADDLAARVAVTGNDELDYLAERLNIMVGQLEERKALREEQQRLEQELAIAWEIQSSFLPSRLPEVSGWQLTATLEPALQTSGDYYDVIALPEDRLGFVVADVADKGTGAALYMALSRTLIRTFASEHADDPARTLQAANRRILLDTHNDLFVTAFYGVLEPHTGRLIYANAGHNPAFVLGRRQPRSLPCTGIPLGILPDWRWEAGQTMIRPGEALLLYTDGITEAQGRNYRQFGADRLVATAQDQLDRSARRMQAAILQSVHRFTGEEPQFDDMTLLIARREPAGAGQGRVPGTRDAGAERLVQA